MFVCRRRVLVGAEVSSMPIKAKLSSIVEDFQTVIRGTNAESHISSSNDVTVCSSSRSGSAFIIPSRRCIRQSTWGPSNFHFHYHRPVCITCPLVPRETGNVCVLPLFQWSHFLKIACVCIDTLHIGINPVEFPTSCRCAYSNVSSK